MRDLPQVDHSHVMLHILWAPALNEGVALWGSLRGPGRYEVIGWVRAGALLAAAVVAYTTYTAAVCGGPFAIYWGLCWIPTQTINKTTLMSKHNIQLTTLHLSSKPIR